MISYANHKFINFIQNLPIENDTQLNYRTARGGRG